MRPGLLKGIILRAVAVVAVLLFSVGLTVAIGLYTTVYPEKINSTMRPDELGLPYEDVNIQSEDGLRIAGWFIPKEGEPSGSAVIVLHGYPTDKGDLLQRSAFLLADHDLFLIDFRNFGASEGDHTTLGLTEVRDLRAAVTYLREERGIERVGVYGFSMGASVALMGVGQVEGIDVVVAEAAYADLRLMAEELYRSFGPLKGLFADLTAWTAKTIFRTDIMEISPIADLRRSTLPILIIHSRKDQVIPFVHAEMIQEALKDNPNAEYSFGDELLHGEASVEFATKTKVFFLTHLAPKTE